MFSEFEIRQMPLSIKSQRTQVERFLADNDLKLEAVDYYAGVFENEGEELLAGGGVQGDVLKCIAVSDKLRDTGMSLQLISHLLSTAQANGHTEMKVFTKPENRKIFESESFHIIDEAPKAILMENTNGLEHYCDYLAKLRKEGTSGVIVMNGNPFTKGHRYLIETASRQVDNLYVIVVKEDLSQFSYKDRLEMIQQGCGDLDNVTVCKGSCYAVSSVTFPTYFIKKVEDATETQITLDLNMFAEHIAPALGATKRFVGSEKHGDETTNRYNKLMHKILPEHGIEVIELPRLENDAHAISASTVRKAIANGTYIEAANLAYPTTIPYIIVHLAKRALLAEVDTTPKPGLVDKHDSGAHNDMDHALMCRSIDALLPYFTELAKLGFQEEFPSAKEVQHIGIKGEKAMLEATQEINTHKGALFSMGLAITATAHLVKTDQELNSGNVKAYIQQLARQLPSPQGTHGAKVVAQTHIDGALSSACKGYPLLFYHWLPFYNENIEDPHVNHKTLLLIMSEIEDTNVYYRKGKLEANIVKQEAHDLLNNFSIGALERMNENYIRRHVSPGGAADMLSLTIFLSSIIEKKTFN